MICASLHKGFDATCLNELAKKYFQDIVLVNRKDVAEKQIFITNQNAETYECRNRVYFKLSEGKKGFHFKINEVSSSVFGTFEKTIVENLPQYSHAVNIVIYGVTEEIKCLLTQLDLSDYFAAGRYYDNTIEVFGFDYGLTTNNYVYDPHNMAGGCVIKLSTQNDALEDNPPYIYKNQNGTEVADFENAFEDVTFELFGDFNDDFNDDFNNQD